MRKARRWARRMALATMGSLACTAGAGWWLLRGSLPDYAGALSGFPLSARVTIERDALGTATLHAGNRHDISFALGFVHAQERFLQMDLQRRRAAGELSELFGPAALPIDREARQHRMRARMRARLAELPDWQRSGIAAYRDGVNAGLARLRVRPFPYLLTGATPAPWREEDTLLCIAAMAFTLNDAGNTRELALARMHAALPPQAYRFLAASGGALDAPLEGAPLGWPEPPPTEVLDLRGMKAATAGSSIDEHLPGSNSFAVAGALAGGPALLANDMHLDLGVPNIWFRTRLVYRSATGNEVDVTGASLPGAPAIVVGSNGQVAWGFTNSYVDTADWVRVERDPGDPDRYRGRHAWSTIERHSEVIHAKGAADEVLEIEETGWGPILGKDADGTSLALAWTAHRPGAIDLGLQRMESARTVEEAIAIGQASGIPPQNLLVGDRSGRIGWSIAGRLPMRVGGYDPALPADWSAADAGWQGWLDGTAIPQVVNPDGGRIWTANQRMVGDDALGILGDGGYDLGARAGQIRGDLFATQAFTPETMLAIQLDDRALLLARWHDLLERTLERHPESPLAKALAPGLHDWNGRAVVTSVAYRLVHDWRAEVIANVLDGFAAPVRQRFPDFVLPKLQQAENAVWMLLEQRPAHLLPGPHADWDALLLSAAERVSARLEAAPGGLAGSTWGSYNTARIRHPLSRALPGPLARWLDMPPDELPGDSNLPRVQGPSFGASERFAVAPGQEASGYFMMPGGQSGHPLSPYYGSGHEDWVHGRATPFLPGPPEQVLSLAPGLAHGND
ncbi:MAG: penicillin acylase family protein [Xanthomonadales bacterium]|nr:penicillin acylase family protein [Xanthomonadales bacterium]